MNQNEYAFFCNVAANLAVKINNFTIFGFLGYSRNAAMQKLCNATT